MTYEANMAKYLRDHKLPTDEGTYPEELMAQITIKAFDELADRIQELVDQLEGANNKLCRCKRQLEKAEDRLEDMYDKLTEIKEKASYDK